MNEVTLTPGRTLLNTARTSSSITKASGREIHRAERLVEPSSFSSPSTSSTCVPWPAYWNTTTSPGFAAVTIPASAARIA